MMTLTHCVEQNFFYNDQMKKHEVVTFHVYAEAPFSNRLQSKFARLLRSPA